MKFMVASDLHGSNFALDNVIDIFYSSGAEKLLLLGDIFGTGADEMVEKLNGIGAHRLTVLKGNNDSYFESAKANFKLFNETYENINGVTAYLCHGHKLNDMFLSGYGAKIVMIGHIHRPLLRVDNGVILMCPGSMAVPRTSVGKTYAIIDEKSIEIFTESGESVDKIFYKAWQIKFTNKK